MYLKFFFFEIYIIFIKYNFVCIVFFGQNYYVYDENQIFFYKVICNFFNNCLYLLLYQLYDFVFVGLNGRKLIFFGIVLFRKYERNDVCGIIDMNY